MIAATKTVLALAVATTAVQGQSFTQYGKMLESWGSCGTDNSDGGFPPLMPSWTYYAANSHSTYGEVFKKGEFVGVCYGVGAPNGQDFSGVGNKYRGGCVDIDNWGDYPCECDALFRNNSVYKMVCDVVSPEGKHVQCTASYAVSYKN